MRLKNVRPSFSRVHLCGVLFALAPFPVGAQTTASADKAFGAFMTNVVGAGQQTVSFASNGQATISTANGNLSMSGQGSVSIGGKPLAVTVKASPLITGLSGVGKLAISLAKVAGPVGIGVAAYDLFSAVKDYSVTYKNTGELDIKKIIKGIECASGCFEYAGTHSYGTGFSGAYFFTKNEASAEACTSLKKTIASVDCGALYYVGDTSWKAPREGQTAIGGNIISRSRPPYDTSSITPATEDDLANAIAAQSGWPSNLRENLVKTLIDSGNAPSLDETTKTITGPNTLGEPKVTTKNLPDGTIEKTTETQKITYEGNNITVTNSSVVTNYNPVTNTTTTTSETNVENPEIAPEADNRSECEKSPDTLGCAKLGEPPAADTLQKTTHALNITAAAFTSSAACPPPVQVAVMGHSYEIPYDPLCDKLALIKPLMMLFAAFIAAYVLADSFKV